MNMNAPMVAKVTSPDYIEPWTTMNDSSSEDEDGDRKNTHIDAGVTEADKEDKDKEEIAS